MFFVKRGRCFILYRILRYAVEVPLLFIATKHYGIKCPCILRCSQNYFNKRVTSFKQREKHRVKHIFGNTRCPRLVTAIFANDDDYAIGWFVYTTERRTGGAARSIERRLRLPPNIDVRRAAATHAPDARECEAVRHTRPPHFMNLAQDRHGRLVVVLLGADWSTWCFRVVTRPCITSHRVTLSYGFNFASDIYL